MINNITTELKEYGAMDWAKLLLVIGLVFLIGLFAVNQLAIFKYNAELLTAPCDLCLELNKNIKLCPNLDLINITSPYSLEVSG